MSKPLVSVCILAYGDAAGLRRTLRYMRAQTYPHVEILVSDDASPQLEVSVAGQAAAQEDVRIRFFRQPENLGIIANHRFLLRQAKGKYLLWACQDDHWHPRYLADAVATLEANHEAVLAMGHANVLDPQGRAYPYQEILDTQGLPPAARFRQVSREILWWNNAWYGLFRRAALAAVPLPTCFGFDLVAVALLSLQGPFVQLPGVYFTKQAGGSGNQLASNLQAIKVPPSWWLRFWPALGPWLALAQGLRAQVPSIRDRVGLLWAARSMLASFTFGRPAWFRRSRQWLGRQKSRLGHRTRQVYARFFLRGNRQAALRAYPWIRPVWLTATAHHLWVAPLEVEITWPQERHVLNHFFTFQALKQQGAQLQTSAVAPLRLGWQGLQLELPGSMEVEVLKEVALAGVYDATLPAGSVVLDVGMNTGITSLWLARQATVTRVYGYEPMPELFAQAQRQFAQNPVLADKICPQPFGLAAGARSAVFAYAPAYGVYSSEFFAPPTEQSTSVHTALHSIGEEMARITAWHPEAPLVLKLDAEGAEYELIPALAEGGWLSRFAYLMIEWHQRGPEPLLVLLEGAGFHTLQRQASPERGMIYALGPGHFPLPLFEASLHETY